MRQIVMLWKNILDALHKCKDRKVFDDVGWLLKK